MKTRGFVAVFFAVALFAAAGETRAAEGDGSTNQGALSAIFQEFLKTALTNLAQSHTNLATISSNAVSGTNIISTLPSRNATMNTNAVGGSASLASLSQLELSDGVRQAIANGLARAVATLGRTNGFLTNTVVKVQMPAQLARVEKMVRAVGQGALADQFVATMNHAAEEAVPVATGIFAESLTQMTIADASNLLLSPSKTAITEYFKRTTTNQLSEKFLPIVRDATQKTGVTAAYKNMVGKARFASAFLGDFDVDHYVTSKALDGLFVMVADQEIRIRENPQARATELLQKVFGALPQVVGSAPANSPKQP